MNQYSDSYIIRSTLVVIWVLALAFCALALLVGCMSPMTFVNNGSANTLEQDQYDCNVQIRQSAYAIAYARDPLGNLAYPYQARREMRDCLIRKGWKEVSDNGSTSRN
jgi:hypothetical protein